MTKRPAFPLSKARLARIRHFCDLSTAILADVLVTRAGDGMKSLFRGIMLFGFGLLAGAGLMAAAFSLHIVRADDGWHWARNQDSHVLSCYADIREWTAEDWSNHPRLAAALVESGQSDLVITSAAEGLVDQLLNTE